MDENFQKECGIFLINLINKLSKKKIVIHSMELRPETTIIQENETTVGVIPTGRKTLVIVYKDHEDI